jgi:hypothetical protein
VDTPGFLAFQTTGPDHEGVRGALEHLDGVFVLGLTHRMHGELDGLQRSLGLLAERFTLASFASFATLTTLAAGGGKRELDVVRLGPELAEQAMHLRGALLVAELAPEIRGVVHELHGLAPVRGALDLDVLAALQHPASQLDGTLDELGGVVTARFAERGQGELQRLELVADDRTAAVFVATRFTLAMLVLGVLMLGVLVFGMLVLGMLVLGVLVLAFAFATADLPTHSLGHTLQRVQDLLGAELAKRDHAVLQTLQDLVQVLLRFGKVPVHLILVLVHLPGDPVLDLLGLPHELMGGPLAAAVDQSLGLGVQGLHLLHGVRDLLLDTLCRRHGHGKQQDSRHDPPGSNPRHRWCLHRL